MNLDTIPPLVWRELAILALSLKFPKTDATNFLQKLDQKFYNGLYETASGGKYLKKTESSSTWSSFVALFRSSQGQTLAKAFGPKKPLPKSIDPKLVLNQGSPLLQEDNGGDKMARVYESYNNRPLVARFQFVVQSGGGIVLYNRMRRACQEYIHVLHDDPRNSVASSWKVFGEEGQIGRSDSCVTYLAAKIDTFAVKELVSYVWKNTKDLIDAQFVAMGMTKIDDKPIWGFNIPAKSKELSVLGEASGGSAGGVMACVLKRAYLAALLELGPKTKKGDRDALIEKAKLKAKDLVTQLYS